jgi:hypothetical protein
VEGKTSRHGPRSEWTLGQNMNITTNVRTIRVEGIPKLLFSALNGVVESKAVELFKKVLYLGKKGPMFNISA